MTETSEKDDTGRRADDRPSTLGGHASHTGGAWVLVLLVLAVLLWRLFFR